MRTGWQMTLYVWQSDVSPRQIHCVHGNLHQKRTGKAATEIRF
jgi:hypothetical protein